MPNRLLVATYVVASFCSAALLFSVQPIIARILLPQLGGSSSVWNTAMVFFQASLLVGYLLAHLLERLPGKAGRFLHLLIAAAALAMLPIGLPDNWSPPQTGNPSGWTLAALLVSVGVPFVFLSTVSPSLQSWFARTDHPAAADPYFLYAAGNVGSVLALLSYPFVIEPALGVNDQARVWSIGFVVAAALVAFASGVGALRPRSHLVAVEKTARPSRSQQMRWLAMSFIPSALLLGVTQHIATDVASFPLLWLIPLTLYLVTYIVAFGGRGQRVSNGAARASRLLIIPVAITLAGVPMNLIVQVTMHLGLFFALALTVHIRLAESRPATDHLTLFYVFLSAGGVLGGLFSGLLAPVIFEDVYEYPIALVGALLVLPAAIFEPPKWLRDQVWAGAAAVLFVAALVGGGYALSDGGEQIGRASIGAGAVVAYIAARHARPFAIAMGLAIVTTIVAAPGTELAVDRTFFGVNRVVREESGRVVLMHGTTVHGFASGESGAPTAYYAPTGPAGQVFYAAVRGPDKSIGVVGLGTGALAAYGRPGDSVTFYEIDEAVAHFAQDDRFFTYLSDSQASIAVEIGDGRLLLARSEVRHDLLVVDAFSSDAIPIHLMTTEAVELYLDRIAPGGQVLLHVTNRNLDLVPVLGSIAVEVGTPGYVNRYVPTRAEADAGASPSDWVVLGPRPSGEGWADIASEAEGPRWTDDYSNILSVFR